MNAADIILAFDGVSAGYGKTPVLSDLSFEVIRGQVFGVIGPNGSGKTTMLNALTGEIRNTSGRIFLEGRDISGLPVDARTRLGIGRTYQIPRPFVKMSVYENVLVSAVYGAGISRSAGREPALDVLRTMGLFEMRNIPSGNLTLLDLKRLEIARAVAMRPRLLLLDEVAAGLTARETDEVIDIVYRLKEAGFTILWIEHDIQTMLKATDTLMCLAEGRLAVIGMPRDVMASPEVEELYLGAGTGAEDGGRNGRNAED